MTARTHTHQLDIPATRAADSTAGSLFRLGGAAAALVVILLVAETIAYLTSSAPSMADAEGWFRLFQAHRLLGLVDFGLLELFVLVLFVPMLLALYTRLKHASPTYAAVAALLAFAGLAAHFASNPLFPLLTLGDVYSATASEAARAQLAAVGQAILSTAVLGGIGGSVQGGFPLAIAGFIFSLIMLRSGLLGRAAAWAGLLANILALAMYAWGAVRLAPEGSPFFAPFLLVSAIWYALIARSLFRLARDGSEQA